MRSVKCRSRDGRILNDTSCDLLKRPEDKKSCYMGSCPGVPVKNSYPVTTSHIPDSSTYSWKSGIWSQVCFAVIHYIFCYDGELGQLYFAFSN